jgi:4-hydroxy-2-oxoglutarate aldolase
MKTGDKRSLSGGLGFTEPGSPLYGPGVDQTGSGRCPASGFSFVVRSSRMRFDSVFPPMPTPFRNGEIDPDAIAFNVSKWMQAGLGGIVALGTNGESGLLDDRESDQVVAAARESVPSDRVLIAGTGRESTRATIAATQRAADLGADAALIRTPSFFKTMSTPALLVRHYTAVADASPIPILLYNFPNATGVAFSADSVAQLAEHKNIVGMKESGTDASQFAQFVDVTPPSFAMLAGSGTVCNADLCLGAVGGILAVAAVVPEICLRVLKAVQEGRYDLARQLQKDMVTLARLVTSGFGVPGLKAALDIAGYKGGDPRPPLLPAPADAREQIRAELARVLEVV